MTEKEVATYGLAMDDFSHRFARPFFAKYINDNGTELRLIGKREYLWNTSVWEVEVRVSGRDPKLVAVLNACDMDENLKLLELLVTNDQKTWKVLEFVVGHELRREESGNRPLFDYIILGWCHKHEAPYVKMV